MATKTDKILRKGYKNIKETTTKLHQEILHTSDELVEGTIASGEQWQKIMAKSMTDGTKLLGKQQVFVINTIEALKKQFDKDINRYSKLFGIDKLWDKGAEAIEDIKKDIKKVAPEFQEDTEEALKKVKKTVSKTRKSLKKATDKTIKKVKESVEDIREDFEDAVEKTMKAAKPEEVKKTMTNDLKVIDGIGPKMEEVLNGLGYKSYSDLAKAKADNLSKKLVEINGRYKIYDPKLWIAQAKLAAAGKWDKLNDYIADIKKGNV